MEGFKKKTIKTSRRLEYTYWVRPSLEKKPALLLQHGFPDDHELWAAIMPYLIPLGFPIIVPDLLGYGESSKPKDYEHYKLKDMSDDLIDILDKEGYQHVISVGHDWGSVMAQRVYLHHPERVVGLIIMNVHYLAPDKNDIKATNAMLTKVTGLPRAAYQEFFISPQGQDVIESDLESFFHALHGRDEGTENFMEDIFCHHVSGKGRSLRRIASCFVSILLMASRSMHSKTTYAPARRSL
jgi:pimeloyl-ACP methyl ester carboxylesterase